MWSPCHFHSKGPKRSKVAEVGIEQLKAQVDTLIAIPNDRLLQIIDKRTVVKDAFMLADEVLRQGIQGISEIITVPGLINLDFADVRTIMTGGGAALIGSWPREKAKIVHWWQRKNLFNPNCWMSALMAPRAF